MKKGLLATYADSAIPPENIFDREERISRQLAASDQSVIDYIKVRGADSEFRKRVKDSIAHFKSRRGPKSDGLGAEAFFMLIATMKKAFRLRSIERTLETYCEMHNLPLEKTSALLDKYHRGRLARKKRGVS